jgi:hypothetical protein
LDSLKKKMRRLRQKVELADLHHNWMEEFDNFKME